MIQPPLPGVVKAASAVSAHLDLAGAGGAAELLDAVGVHRRTAAPGPQIAAARRERVRSLDPDIAYLESEGVAAFAAAPLEGLEKDAARQGGRMWSTRASLSGRNGFTIVRPCRDRPSRKSSVIRKLRPVRIEVAHSSASQKEMLCAPTRSRAAARSGSAGGCTGNPPHQPFTRRRTEATLTRICARRS